MTEECLIFRKLVVNSRKKKKLLTVVSNGENKTQGYAQ